MAGSYNWDTNEWIEPDTGGSTVPVAGAPVQASAQGGGGIASWFGMGPQQQSTVPNVARSTMDNPAIQRIAKAYGITPDSKDPQQQLMLNHLRTMAQFQPKAPDPNAMMRARMGAALTAVGAALNPKVNLTKLSAQQLAAARQRAQQYQDSQSKFGMTMAQMMYQAQLAKLQRDRNISTFKAAMGGQPAPTGAQPGVAPGMPTPGTEFAPSGTIDGIMPGASVPPDAMPQVPAVPPTSDGTMPNYDPGQMQFGDIGQEQAPPADLPSVPGISVGSAVEDAGAPAPPPAPSPYAPTNAVATPNEVTTTQVAAPAGEAAPPPRDPSQPPPASGNAEIDRIQQMAYARALQQAASDPGKAIAVMQDFHKWAYDQRRKVIDTQIAAGKFGLDQRRFALDQRKADPEYIAEAAAARARGKTQGETAATAPQDRRAAAAMGEIFDGIAKEVQKPGFEDVSGPLRNSYIGRMVMDVVTSFRGGDGTAIRRAIDSSTSRLITFLKPFYHTSGSGPFTDSDARIVQQMMSPVLDARTKEEALQLMRKSISEISAMVKQKTNQDISIPLTRNMFTEEELKAQQAPTSQATTQRPAKVPVGTIRTDRQTGQRTRWNGTRWVPAVPPPAPTGM